MEPTVCFVSASRQNVFFAELLDALAEALANHGVAVERSIDCFPQLRDELVYVFVPHELLPLIMPDAHPSEPQLRRSIAICTEQPGTSWFKEDARIAKRSAAAVDINRLGVSALRKQGIEATLLPLGYVPSWDHWQGEQASERPVDVTFQGGATSRRLTALARCGRFLAGRRTELHLFESGLPHQADSEHFISGARKWSMLRDSKIMMNVHQSDLGYLEWQRAIGAMANGCVFLSEHSLGFEPLVPGEHFVSVSFDSLDVALERLLEDDDRLARIRKSAYAFLRDQNPLSSSIGVLAEIADDIVSRPITDVGSRTRPAVPRPRPLISPLPEYVRVLQTRSDLDIVRMALKQMLLDQRELRKEVHDIRAQIGSVGGGRDGYKVERLGPHNGARPRVSVVITVYNYESLVGTAIASVAASDFEEYEMVIVDDASSDHSNDAIKAALGSVPWARATLVTQSRNEGLARARNLGAELAEAELLFILDADNSIYPNALGRLVRALDERQSADFAYGIIEQFGAEGPSSLVSYLGWDPQRLRYGNFVDAMAMLRRSALLDVGGYVTDSRLHGWEDFALWCAFADQGHDGVRVPEIVARYRVALHSMISVSNIDASAAWSLLLDRFSCLSAEGT